MGYVNLHVHSAKGSLLDSIATTQDIVKFADDNNQSAIAISDHGSLASFVDLFKESKKHNVKPIMACEVYEVDDMNFRQNTKDYKEQRYHLLLVAKNQQGKLNLQKIVSLAGTEGRYVKPRIDLKTIKANNLGAGIIASTACMAGRLSKYLSETNIEGAVEFTNSLKNTFDNVYCEIQSHDTPEQAECNKLIYDFSVKQNLPCIVTSDAHMISEQDIKAHSIFVYSGMSREVGETYKDCYLQTESDVYRILGKQFSKDIISKLIESTQDIADSVEYIDVGIGAKDQIPNVDVPAPYNTSLEYMKHLISVGFKNKFKNMSVDEQKRRYDRIKMEIPVLVELGFVNYFIIVYDVINKIRELKIPLGYARGSAASCLCLYCMVITQIDSVKWNLDFSRFANLGRKGTLADIDFDISKRRRSEVIQACRDMFGKDNVASISTFNTFTTKVAIRDIGKSLNDMVDSPYKGKIPYSLRNEVAKQIPELQTKNDDGTEIDKKTALKNAIKGNEVLENASKEFPLWFDYVLKLEGLPKSRGKNASAIMISPKPLVEYGSFCLDKDGLPMMEQEMHNLMDDLGILKLDILGLRNLDIVDDTLKLSNISWNDINIDHLDTDDKTVFDTIFKTGNTSCIFQMESVEARNMCKQANVDSVNDIVVVNAANRPGTRDQFPDYCKNKLHPDQVKVVHPDLLEIFKDSHSVMMYQEQALSLFRYAGFPDDEVDVARRAIGKKMVDVMKTLETKFKDGLHKKGWNDEQCCKTWELLVKQSSYSFNKCLTGNVLLRRTSGCTRDIKYPTQDIPIKEVFDRFNSNSAVGKKYRSNNQLRGLFIECRDSDGRARKHKVKNVYEQGEKPVWKIKLDNGKTVKATSNHRFQVKDNGYKRVDQLIVGDYLWCCDFEYEKTNKRWNLSEIEEGKSDYDVARGKRYEGMGFKEGADNPAWLGGNYVKYNEYRNKKDGICECCGIRTDRLETHHIDGNRLNNDWSNLENICVACHKKKHYRELGRTKQGEKGYPTYLSKIISIKYFGIEMTYDVEIESDEHNFFANGICSHNSHAVAYSLLSYLTAYLKTYHPVEFMTACMINEDNFEKLSTVINETKRIGIKVTKPDINLSGKNFTPDTDNNQIRYGFSSIKGISTKSVQYILDNRPFDSIKTLVNDSISGITKNSMIALIKAGALDSISNGFDRKTQLKYYYSIRFNNKKETLKPIKTLNKKNIQEMLDNGVINKYNNDKEQNITRFNLYRKHIGWVEFQDKYMKGDVLSWEMETLSTFLSGSPLNGVKLPDWSKVGNEKFGCIGGTIILKKENKVKKGKSKGKKMAFLNIDTNYGVIDTVVFADKWQKYQGLLNFGNTVFVQGLKKGKNKMFCNKVITLEEYKHKTGQC